MKCSKKLQKRVFNSCERYRRFHSGKFVLCGCEFNQYCHISTNRPYMTEHELETMLDGKLVEKIKTLGRLGHRRVDMHAVGCFNYLGNCAEVHSANGVYKQMRYKKPEVHQLNFSIALRINTLQPIPYCQNCIDTFNLINK